MIILLGQHQLAVRLLQRRSGLSSWTRLTVAPRGCAVLECLGFTPTSRTRHAAVVTVAGGAAAVAAAAAAVAASAGDRHLECRHRTARADTPCCCYGRDSGQIDHLAHTSERTHGVVAAVTTAEGAAAIVSWKFMLWCASKGELPLPSVWIALQPGHNAAEFCEPDSHEQHRWTLRL